jgi:hypothetical protein
MILANNSPFFLSFSLISPIFWPDSSKKSRNQQNQHRRNEDFQDPDFLKTDQNLAPHFADFLQTFQNLAYSLIFKKKIFHNMLFISKN